MKNNLYLLLAFIFILCACSEPKVRKPKQQSVTSFYKELISQNKKLNELEKKKIENYLLKDTLVAYKTSPSGFWYTYVKKDSTNLMKTPKSGDLVTLNYSISDVRNNILYKNKTIEYKVDKEDFIPALQEGIKLIKKGEVMTFVIPSYRAYGVTGDGNKIGMNQTIKSTVTLIDIKKEEDETN